MVRFLAKNSPFSICMPSVCDINLWPGKYHRNKLKTETIWTAKCCQKSKKLKLRFLQCCQRSTACQFICYSYEIKFLPKKSFPESSSRISTDWQASLAILKESSTLEAFSTFWGNKTKLAMLEKNHLIQFIDLIKVLVIIICLNLCKKINLII